MAGPEATRAVRGIRGRGHEGVRHPGRVRGAAEKEHGSEPDEPLFAGSLMGRSTRSSSGALCLRAICACSPCPVQPVALHPPLGTQTNVIGFGRPSEVQVVSGVPGNVTVVRVFFPPAVPSW